MAYGMIMGQAGGSGKSILSKFQYTGRMLYQLKFMCGKNFCEVKLEQGGLNTSTGATTVSTTEIRVDGFTWLDKGSKYVISATCAAALSVLYVRYNSAQTFVAGSSSGWVSMSSNAYAFTAPADGYYRFTFKKASGDLAPSEVTDLQFELGTAKTAYEAFERKLYHLFIMETSGTLTVTGDWTGDIWLCGGGCDGYVGSTYGDSAGGCGGYTTNASAQTLASGAAVIGANGAPAGNTSFAGLTANGGTVSAGGSGSGRCYTPNGAIYPAGGTGQGSTTRPFSSHDMRPQCNGGGAGSYADYTLGVYVNGGDSGYDGGNGNAGTAGSQYNFNAGNGGSAGGKGGVGSSGGSRGADMGNRVGTGFAYGIGGGGSNVSKGYGSAGAVMIRIAA